MTRAKLFEIAEQYGLSLQVDRIVTGENHAVFTNTNLLAIVLSRPDVRLLRNGECRIPTSTNLFQSKL